MPKVSVVIPVYNAGEYLPKCLDSVCSQTLRELEILCIDDASSDGSPDILRRYAGKDRRIKVIRLTENRGAAAARNVGLDAASGTYIGFVDSDDFIDATFYADLYRKAAEDGADIAKGTIRRFDPATGRSWMEAYMDINDRIRQHKANFCYAFTSALYSSSLIRRNGIRFPEGLIRFEDPYFAIQSALFAGSITFAEQARYLYTINPGSATQTHVTIAHIDAQIDGSDLILDLLDGHDVDGEYYRIVFGFLLEEMLGWCGRVDVPDAVTRRASEGLDGLLSRCRDRSGCIAHYFARRKADQRRRIAIEFREKILRNGSDSRLSDLRR